MENGYSAATEWADGRKLDGAPSFQIIGPFLRQKLALDFVAESISDAEESGYCFDFPLEMDEHLRIGTGCVSERVLWQLQDDDLDPFTGLRYLIWAPETRRGGGEQDYKTRYSQRDLYVVRKNSNRHIARRLDRRWIATADLFF